MSLLKSFWRNKRGNVATMFAIALIPLLGATGASVDYARIARVHQKLADALDAGVLAVGSQPPMSDAKAFDAVDAWVKAHMVGIPYKLESVAQTGEGITGTASSDVDMSISRILGVDDVVVSVTSQVLRTIGKIELVLVLDNTGSMKGKKIATLISAANQLVDSLSKATKNPADLRIGLVPFSQTVNVGSEYQTAKWIDAAGESPAAKSLFLNQKVNRFDLFKQLGAKWGGCVETRPMPYETTDTFDEKNVDSLYVPYFAPDEPGNKGDKTYNNSYLTDSSAAAIQANLGLASIPANTKWKYLQGDVLKYAAGNPLTGSTQNLGYKYGPNSGCEIAPMLRLTSDTGAVHDAIKKMIAQGNTDIPAGLAWGWNVLSPNGPFGDGKPYKDGEWTKIVVLMTDGNNENNEGNANDESFYSGVGYMWQGRMGATSGSKSKRTTLRDQRLEAMCTGMKAAGKTAKGELDHVTVYTIRVEVKNGSSSALQNCASDGDKFYDVQNVDQLVSVFQDIGGSIQKLRIAM
jgi:Flp pilus assembly protein TadG